MALCLLLATGAYGSVRSGSFDAFVENYGPVRDIAARTLGFSVDAITIGGQRELISTEVLKAAGIRPQDSLLFLDAAKVRDNLLQVPMIQSANVRKLYPNQLVISVVERRAHALWQWNGEVAIISADGQPIDRMRDQRYARLPFLVGEGANKKLAEYRNILQAAGALRPKIRAGTLIGQRRWTIKFKNGLDLKLPEGQPQQAMERFAILSQKHNLLDKDLLVIDMRVPGRMIGHLSAEAVAKRSGNKSAKPRKKAGAA